MNASHRLASTLFAALALAAVCSSAQAQWVWKDETGHTIASDQPPPINTPPSRIIRQPKGRPAATAAAPAPEAKDAPKSVADRDLESKQRAKEAAEAQKKSDDEAARARTMKENCAQVRSNVAALQAGGRAARFNEKGEKVYIDDTQRAAEIQKGQQQVSQFCNS
jgi:Domain of unknown function (DUF4124)